MDLSSRSGGAKPRKNCRRPVHTRGPSPCRWPKFHWNWRGRALTCASICRLLESSPGDFSGQLRPSQTRPRPPTQSHQFPLQAQSLPHHRRGSLPSESDRETPCKRRKLLHAVDFEATLRPAPENTDHTTESKRFSLLPDTRSNQPRCLPPFQSPGKAAKVTAT